jgi:hypothetical protein
MATDFQKQRQEEFLALGSNGKTILGAMEEKAGQSSFIM